MNTQWFKQDRQWFGLPAKAACHETTSLLTDHTRDRYFTSLGHLITDASVRHVLDGLKRNSSPGVDGISPWEFRLGQASELPRLVRRLRDRTYKCRPNRRVLIPKQHGDGYRSLGIPCMVDKVAQGIIKAILEPIYESVFYPESYGYRPGRNCHQAVSDLRDYLQAAGGGVIIDADLRKFFDSVPHGKLMCYIEKKVKDPVILHTIRSFLRAGTLVETDRPGVMKVVKSDIGTPQGGVISPLLANIYLHYVLDSFIHEIRPSIAGGVGFFRYADDFVCVVSSRDQAAELLNRIETRLAEHGIPVNEEKTKKLDFRKSNSLQDHTTNGEKCFKFLGFEMSWGTSPQVEGKVLCRPAEGRIQRALERAHQAIADEPKPITPQRIRQLIAQRVYGFTSYYSLNGCEADLSLFKLEMAKLENGLCP